ncbi:Translocator-like protein [Tripterygium wilfordii]|uniref:Translocator-like protein n=1 Tax=Tripterygium wilfordii TaxID=458696 RepID=A0A7J7CXI4_TRIWF|nr:translocator protein homolog [Tripterygium wilfordii]KAF5738718.1 Translocator-like protein [Tripterygium wilfordii]
MATTIPATAAAKVAKKGKAKRALPSLAMSIAIPLLLTLVIILLFGSGHKYRAMVKPFWFPPLWLIHLSSLGSSLVMGLAVWLVWADGGFHSEPDALPLYIGQVSLSIVWDPLVLVIGSASLGFVFCLVNFGTLFACYSRFKRVNPFSKDLVKVSLVWTGYLSIVTYKIIYL